MFCASSTSTSTQGISWNYSNNFNDTCEVDMDILYRNLKEVNQFPMKNTKENIKKMYDNNIKNVRVFESVATKDRERKDGTKIEKGEVTKITEVTFQDGDIERAYCDPVDTFDLSMGIMICIAKWACEGTCNLYKQIKDAEKIYQKPFDDAKKAEEEKARAKHRDEKRRKEKQKQIDRRREKRIEEQKEAYLRAMKEYNAERKAESAEKKSKAKKAKKKHYIK